MADLSRSVILNILGVNKQAKEAIDEVDTDAKALEALNPEIHIGADDKAAMGALAATTAAFRAFGNEEFSAKLGADASAAIRDLATFETALRGLSAERVGPTISLEQGNILKEIGIIEAELEGLDRAFTPGVKFDESGARIALQKLRLLMEQTGVSDFLDTNLNLGQIYHQLLILKRYIKQVGVNDFLDINADTGTITSAMDKFKAFSSQISETINTNQAQAALASLQEAFSKLQSEQQGLNPTVNLGSSEAALGQLGAQYNRIKNELSTPVGITIDVPTENNVLAKIALIDQRLNALKAMVVDPKIEINAGTALAELQAINLALLNVKKELSASGSVGLGSGLDAVIAKFHDLQAAMATTDQGLAAIASTEKTTEGSTSGLIAKMAAAQAGFTALGGAVDTTHKTFGVTNPDIALFGGVLGHLPILGTASSFLILAHAIIEIGAVLIPAAVAFGAFAIAAATDVQTIITRMQNLQTVSDATGHAIGPLSNGFDKLAAAVRPEVYQLFGDALTIISSKTGAFTNLAVAAGQVVDNLAARFTLAITGSKNFGQTLMQNAIPDLAKLGDIIGNIGGIIGNLLHALPGFAQVFLNIADAASKVAENLSGMLIPAEKVLFWAHGLILYGGLAATALTKIGSAAVIGIGGLIEKAGSGILAISRFAGAGERAGMAVGRFGEAVGNVGKFLGGPWGVAIALAVTAVTAFVIWALHARDAAQQFGDKMQAMVNAAPAVEGMTALFQAQVRTSQNLAQAHAVVAKGLDDLGHKLTANEKLWQINTSNYNLATNNAQEYSGQLKILSDEQNLFTYRLGVLSKETGSQRSAFELLTLAGIKTGDMLKYGSQQLAMIQLKVAAVTQGYQAMGQRAGMLGSDLNALTISGSDQVSAMNKLNSAWDTTLKIVSGGQTSFIGFEQSIQTVNRDAGAAGASMNGLSAASLTLRNDWQSAYTAGGQLIDALRLQTSVSNGSTAVQKLLAGATKDVVAQLYNQGKNSAATRGELIALAQEVNPNIHSFQQLTQWLGNTQGKGQDLNKLVAKLGLNISDLTKDAQNLSATMQADVTSAFAQAALKATGADAAVTQAAQAVTKYGKGATQVRGPAVALYNDLVKTGENAQQARDLVATLTGVIVKAGAAAAQAAPQISKGFGTAGKAAHAAATDFASYNAAVEKGGTASQPAINAQKALINDLIAAKVPRAQAILDVNNYAKAIKQYGINSSQARSAAAYLIADFTAAGKNASQGQRDLNAYNESIKKGTEFTAQGQAQRARLIQDLIHGGMSAKDATTYVNGLTVGINRNKAAVEAAHGFEHQIANDFNLQGTRAKEAMGYLNALTRAVAGNNNETKAGRAARQKLIDDLIAAGVKSSIARKDVDAYSLSVAKNGSESDKTAPARKKLINDILQTSRNSLQGKKDLEQYAAEIQKHHGIISIGNPIRLKLINDLKNTGLSSKDATGLVNGLTTAARNQGNATKNAAEPLKQWGFAARDADPHARALAKDASTLGKNMATTGQEVSSHLGSFKQMSDAFTHSAASAKKLDDELVGHSLYPSLVKTGNAATSVQRDFSTMSAVFSKTEAAVAKLEQSFAGLEHNVQMLASYMTKTFAGQWNLAFAKAEQSVNGWVNTTESDLTRIKNSFNSIITQVKNNTQSTWSSMFRGMEGTTSNFVNNTNTEMSHLKNVVDNAFNSVKNNDGHLWSSFWDGIKNTTTSQVDWQAQELTRLENDFTSSFTKIKTTVENLNKGMWDNLDANFQSAYNKNNTDLKNLLNAYDNYFNQMKTNVDKEYKQLWDDLASEATQGVNKTNKNVVPIEGGFHTPFLWVVDHVIKPFGNIWNTLDTSLKLGITKFPAVPSFGAGGVVPGHGMGDVVPAMLTPGERVLSLEQVAKLGGHAAIDFLVGKGAAGNSGFFAAGGIVPVETIIANAAKGASLKIDANTVQALASAILELPGNPQTIAKDVFVTGQSAASKDLTAQIKSQLKTDTDMEIMAQKLGTTILNGILSAAYAGAGTGGGGSIAGLMNPLRGAHVTPERIDQGVDYAASGPIYAIGAGTIDQTTNAGWPGGAFIEERLTAGYPGKYWYDAESITPTVRVGQSVTTGTVIGQMHGQIEIGWGAGNGGNALAAIMHEQATTGDPGRQTTGAGLNANKLLVALGAPSGIVQGATIGPEPSGYYGSTPAATAGTPSSTLAVGPLASFFPAPTGGTGTYSGTGGTAVYTYLLNNLFQGQKPAAAGATASIWGESAWNPEAINCVPLTYKVVTTRGILAHDEVRIGDKTPVLNPNTGIIENATILDVPYHDNAKICRIGNSRWSVTCTWDHKWITASGKLVRADDLEIGSAVIWLGENWYETVDFFEDKGRLDTFCLTTTTGTWTTYRDEIVAKEEGVDEGALWTGNSGGRGLIGWTPYSTLPNADYTGNAAHDMPLQLAQIVVFVKQNGDMGVISNMINASKSLPAHPGAAAITTLAQMWGRGVERYGIPDVHPQGVALAMQIAGLAGGGIINEPIFGMGASGRPYLFGERGSEMIIPMNGVAGTAIAASGSGDTYIAAPNFNGVVGDKVAVANEIWQILRHMKKVRGNISLGFE